MRKLLNLIFALLLVASPALAGSGTLDYAPSGSSPMRQTTDGSSNNLPNMTIWDYSAGANGLAVGSDHNLTTDQGTAAGSGPWIFTPWIAGAVNSATNGLFTNLLQGNAVLGAGNPIYVAPGTGAAWVAPGFTQSVVGTPFTVTTGGATSASFTSSTVVVLSNVGTTNGAYCAPGASATTSNQYIAPGAWFSFYAS